MTSATMIKEIGILLTAVVTAVVGVLTFYYGTYLPSQEELPTSPPSSDTTEKVTPTSPPSSDTTEKVTPTSLPPLEPDVASPSTTKQENTSSPPVVCQKYYYFNTELKKCIPELEPEIS
jgi:hypothetical protein